MIMLTLNGKKLLEKKTTTECIIDGCANTRVVEIIIIMSLLKRAKYAVEFFGFLSVMTKGQEKLLMNISKLLTNPIRRL